MNRRDFLQSSCQLCLLGLLGASTIAVLDSCAASSTIYKTNVRNNEIEIPLNLLDGKKVQIVRAPETDFDIAVRTEADGTHKAFLLACTHHDNPLNVTGNGFICPLHGSQFDLEGNVRKGPASLPLTQYPTKVINDKLLIHITA